MTAAGAENFDGDTVFVERPGGFDQVPERLWLGGAVSPGALMTYVAISRRGGRDDRAMPKRSTLAGDMDISKRALDGRLDELIEKGWLLITPRVRDNADSGQTSNHYHLLWSPIEAEDDPRLVKHLQRVAEFHAAMDERQRKNGSTGTRSVRAAAWRPPAQNAAPSPRAETCATPAQADVPPPAQKPALQEAHHLQTRTAPTEPSPSPAAAATVEDEFDRFWAVYPRKTGKNAARTCWDRAIAGDQRKHRPAVDPAVIIAGAIRYANDPNQLPPEEARYIPHPATWLHRGSWEDGPLPPRGATRASAEQRRYDDGEWDRNEHVPVDPAIFRPPSAAREGSG